MSEGTVYVGLDVHKATIAAAIASEGREQPTTVGVFSNDPSAIRKFFVGLQGRFGRVEVAYEAGPTGYGVHRQLTSMGIDCRVVAPSQIPKRAGDRVKTDRRDAEKLARLLRSGDLDSVWVPDRAHEALRNLLRARGDAKMDLIRDRHRLLAFLLRMGMRGPEGVRSTSLKFDRWLDTVSLEFTEDTVVFGEYRASVRASIERLQRIESALFECAQRGRHADLIQALQVFRGIGLLTAITLVSEIGDFRRFPTARHLMAYVGIVPSEHSSGATLRRGRITKSGNHLLRFALIESAQQFRRPPNVSPIIRKRHDGMPPELIEMSWKAQKRLHYRYRQLGARIGRPKALVAVARELTGFVWAAGQFWEGNKAA